MTHTFPTTPRFTRWLVILLGVVIFVWLSFEDTHVWPVALLGALAAGLSVSLWATGRFGGRMIAGRVLPLYLATLGGLTGASASVITALLMLFKNVRHAHLFPDFPLEMIGAILARIPAWTGAGVLIGVGLGFVWLTLRPVEAES